MYLISSRSCPQLGHIFLLSWKTLLQFCEGISFDSSSSSPLHFNFIFKAKSFSTRICNACRLATGS